MLKVERLNVFHGNLHVIWDISFHVGKGEIVTLLGSNGAGKTTTAETLFGLNSSASGKIEFLGTDILGKTPFDIVKMGIAFVPEKRELFPKMTVQENHLPGKTTTGNENAPTSPENGSALPAGKLLHERILPTGKKSVKKPRERVRSTPKNHGRKGSRPKNRRISASPRSR